MRLMEPTDFAATQRPQGWTMDGFARFWGKPDVSRVAEVLTGDIVGYWPDRAPARGIAEYTKVLADVIALLPDLRLEVMEHAVNGDCHFIRWVMRATGRHGPFELTGIDRIRLCNGRVAENIIRFDSEEFRRLAGHALPGTAPVNRV